MIIYPYKNEKRKFSTLNKEYIKKNLHVTRMFGVFTPTMMFMTGVAAILSLWLGGKHVITGSMTLGSLVAFNGYLMLLSWPMMGIGYVLLTDDNLILCYWIFLI